MSERDAPAPAAGLVHALADRELLVVLDNCVHVLEAAAGPVATLLAQCPQVASDRHPLPAVDRRKRCQPGTESPRAAGHAQRL